MKRYDKIKLIRRLSDAGLWAETRLLIETAGLRDGFDRSAYLMADDPTLIIILNLFHDDDRAGILDTCEA